MDWLDFNVVFVLMVAFGRQRVWTFFVLAIIVAIYVLGAKARPDLAAPLGSLYLGALIVFIVTVALLTRRRLRALQMPPAYMRESVAGQAVQYAAVALLIGVIAAGR